MAIIADVDTGTEEGGATRQLYVRLNNVEASNHGAEAHALFRGFASEKAYRTGKRFVWETTITFKPDVSQPLWEQAYAALGLKGARV